MILPSLSIHFLGEYPSWDGLDRRIFPESVAQPNGAGPARIPGSLCFLTLSHRKTEEPGRVATPLNRRTRLPLWTAHRR